MKSVVISVISNRKHITLPAYDILYIHLESRKSVIHAAGGKTYETYTTIDELSEMLGESFIRADRATLVSAKAIHNIGKKIELINGETLDFTRRRKRELKDRLRLGRRQIMKKLSDSDAPNTREEYQHHYASFDSVPFAFTDIEMVFNEEQSAVDWIFRYGNEALAKLENIPPHFLTKKSKYRTTVRRLTNTLKSSAFRPFAVTAAVCCLTVPKFKRFAAMLKIWKCKRVLFNDNTKIRPARK